MVHIGHSPSRLDPGVSLAGEPLPLCRNPKILGVTLDLYLTFAYHVGLTTRARGGIEPNAIRRLQARQRRILGRNFKTKLLNFSVFSCSPPSVFIHLSIQHNLTLKRKKKENTEQVRSFVAKFLPSVPLRGKAVIHTYEYSYQQIPYSHYSK